MCLRLAGMQEKINYVEQFLADAASGRADFTFLLPNDLKANMDVKFPLENYKAYLDAATDPAGPPACASYCHRRPRPRPRVAHRGYIDPKVPTVPYVIVFIPSEQIFSLVLGAEPDLIDEALKSSVVLCSPLTLYAKLAIMRQTAESFDVTKTANEVIALLGQFVLTIRPLCQTTARQAGQRITAAGEQDPERRPHHPHQHAPETPGPASRNSAPPAARLGSPRAWATARNEGRRARSDERTACLAASRRRTGKN